MDIKLPEVEEINALTGLTDTGTGIVYPANGLQPYYLWLMQTIHQLNACTDTNYKTWDSAESDTSVYISQGKCRISGTDLTSLNGTIELAQFNNSTVNIAIIDGNTQGQSGVGIIERNTIWPSIDHFKIAKVTLANGKITNIKDQRHYQTHQAGLNIDLQNLTFSITNQGDISTPTSILLQASNYDNLESTQTLVARVQVCNHNTHTLSDNATISTGVNTQKIYTHTATKDIELRGDNLGQINLELNLAIAESVTLRIGPPRVGGLPCDYQSTLQIAHT